MDYINKNYIILNINELCDLLYIATYYQNDPKMVKLLIDYANRNSILLEINGGQGIGFHFFVVLLIIILKVQLWIDSDELYGNNKKFIKIYRYLFIFYFMF